MKNLSFRQRQLLVLVTMVLAPMIVAVALAFTSVRSSAIEQTTAQMELMADLKTTQVYQWLAQGQMVVRLISTQPFVHFALTSLRTSGDAAVQSRARTGILEGINALVNVYPYVKTVSFLEPDTGRVFLSTAPERVGQISKDEDFFRKGQLALYAGSIVYAIDKESPVLTISAPVKAGNGDLLAVLVVDMNLSDLIAIFHHQTGPSPWRTFLVDAQGHYITPVIEGTRVVPQTPAQTEGVRRALAQGNGSLIYQSADNEKVLGVYRWLPDGNLGLLVEVDYARIVDKINRTTLLIVGLAGLILLAGILAAQYLSRWLMTPLEQIAGVARSLQNGDLTRRVSISGSDEIAQLAQTFNQMAAGLQQSYQTLEQQVAERTAELTRANEQLQYEIVERKQAQEKVDEHNRELTLLNRVIAASAFGQEPEAVLEIACRELAQAFDAPQCTASLIDNGRNSVTVMAEYLAEGRSPLLVQKFPLEHAPIYRLLITTQAPIIIDHTDTDPRLESVRSFMRQRQTVSLLAIPLMIENEVIGGLVLESPERGYFTMPKVGLAWSATDQIANALARTRLAKNQQLLITAVEQLAESVVIAGIDGVITYVNSAFERVSGYTRAEAMGRHLNFLAQDGNKAGFFESLWATVKSGQTWHGRIISRNKSGLLFTEEATINPVRDKAGYIISVVQVKRDVTRELELEEQYRQAQKMEALGRLTGGISHDFNNLLTAINGFAELIQRRLPADSPLQPLVGNILRSGQRAANLVRQLLTFSRKQASEHVVLDVNMIITDMNRMLQRIIDETIEIHCVLAPDLWRIQADQTQLEQVVVNLAVNARDAMPDGGRLTIQTDNIIFNDGAPHPHRPIQLSQENYVLLKVQDTGVGMSEDVKAHLFEPFFTTKAKGKGTGLGLATCYGIVTQSNGYIYVDSELNQGTTFSIYLPACHAEVSAPAQAEQINDDHTGHETILLAEDEDSLREMMSGLLRQNGYTLLEAPDGQAALVLAEKYPGKIDLLLTDVIMPHLDGKQLADALSARLPHLKVIFISGYTDDIIAQRGILAPGITFVQKPFSSITLLQKIRSALQE